MRVIQKEISLPSFPRGVHLITPLVEKELTEIKSVSAGLFNLFIKHTSASLAINENADPTVRQDLERYLNRTIPENVTYYQHTDEGPDDMPAHIKAVFIGSSLTVPITQGCLNLGIWQGIYLCEHRNHGGIRHLVATIWGNMMHKL